MKKWIAALIALALITSCVAFGLVGSGDVLEPTLNKNVKYKIGYTEGFAYTSYAAHLYGILIGLKELGWIDSLEGLPYTSGDDDTAAMWRWLVKNQPSKYLEFVSDGYYSFDGDESKMAEAYTRIHNGSMDMDIMLAMGTKAGRTMTAETPDVPVLVFSTSNAMASEIITSVTDSGKDNVWAHVDLTRYRKQVEVLYDIFGFKKLGIIYEDSLEGRSYADLDNVQDVCDRLGVQLVRRNVKENLTEEDYLRYKNDMQKAFNDLSDEVDAFYLTAGNLKAEELPPMFEPFYDHKVPVFSQLGGDEVAYGALISTAANYVDIGRFGAQVISRSLHGENSRYIPATYEDTPKIIMNLDVAKRIEYTPDFEILLIADKLYLNRKEGAQ